jgi:acyl-CoA thioesterase
MTEFEELSPNFKNALLTKVKKNTPFWSLIDMDLVDVKKGWARVRLPYDKKLDHAYGSAHGAAVFAPADSAVAMALQGMVAKDEVFTTVEMKINYLKPFYKGEIVAEAKIIHKGGNIAIGDVEVRDAKGSLVAKALATYMIMKQEG